MIGAPDTEAAVNKREKWMCHSQGIAAIMSGKLEELGAIQSIGHQNVASRNK